MEYNFKSNERLQITDFCCEDCVVFDILDTNKHLREYECIEVYAKGDFIGNVFKSILQLDEKDEFSFGAINFCAEEIDYDYGDVYCLTVNYDNEIWIEPAYRYNDDNGKYETFNSEATLAYVYQEDVKQDLMDMLEKNKVNTLLFGFDEE